MARQDRALGQLAAVPAPGRGHIAAPRLGRCPGRPRLLLPATKRGTGQRRVLPYRMDRSVHRSPGPDLRPQRLQRDTPRAASKPGVRALG